MVNNNKSNNTTTPQKYFTMYGDEIPIIHGRLAISYFDAMKKGFERNTYMSETDMKLFAQSAMREHKITRKQYKEVFQLIEEKFHPKLKDKDNNSSPDHKDIKEGTEGGDK